MKTAFALLASLSAVTAVTAYAQPRQSLVDIAVNDGRFSTLVTALQATGLDKAVADASEERPLTVFAPTNDAFAKIDPSTLDNLLKNPTQLAGIIKLHVVRGLVSADSIVLRKRVPTLVGFIQCPTDSGCVDAHGRIKFFSATPTTRGNTVSIAEEGIMASNGMIHAIDSVLLPPAH